MIIIIIIMIIIIIIIKIIMIIIINKDSIKPPNFFPFYFKRKTLKLLRAV